MPYNLIERLDYSDPVTLPTPSFVLGTATGVGFTGMAQVGSAFSTTVSVNNATAGTLFVYVNSIRLLATVSLRVQDVVSASTVINRILCPRTINIGVGTSDISLSVIQSGQSFILTVTTTGTVDGTVVVNEETISVVGQQRNTTATIAAQIALANLNGFSTSYTAGSSSITYTTLAYPSWSLTSVGTTLTFTCTAPYVVSPSTYPYVQIVKQDSAYIVSDPTAQDSLTSSIIRGQSSQRGLDGPNDQGAGDYVTVTDPIVFLHSTMQNQFYKNLTFSIQQEWQNVIDKANELKTLFNIDYFDGDTTAFSDKVNAILSLFAYTAPLTFVPYTNVENGDIPDITKQNDFVRNIAKRIWLQRRWAGTLSGYLLLPKFFNRLGAIHLGVQYTTLTLTPLTGKIYRLLDFSQLLQALPGANAYPDSVNVLGAQNIRQVQVTYPAWDTGLSIIDVVGIYNLNSSPSGSATGIVFSIVFQSVTTPYVFSFSVNSVAGATIGTIYINNNIINISDVSTTTSVANQIVAFFANIQSTSGFLVSIGNTTSTLVFKTNPPPIQFDAPTPFGTAQRSLLIEFGLDRTLHHTNSLGSKLSLMDNFFLDSLNSMVPNVKRARDIVYVGSQITLVTGKDGSYNKLSGNSLYSHPNIQALFQVMFYKPDKTTQAWSTGAVVNYLKIGTGSWGSSVFVDAIGGQKPNDSNKVIPTDLQNPIFQTQIGQFEKGFFGGFNILNVVVHPKSHSNITPSPSPTLIVNGINTYGSSAQDTTLVLPEQYVADGSVAIGFQFDNVMPPLGITYSGTGLVISSSAPTSASYLLKISSGSATDGSLTLVGASIPITGSPRTPSQIATTIVTYFNSGAGANTGWIATSATIGGVVTVTLNYTLLVFHQRVWVYEQYNPMASVYDSTYKYQELNSLGTAYIDFSDQSLLQGYTTDPLYSSSTSNYFPTIQKRVFNLLPLTIADQFPTLSTGQIAKFTFDEGTAGAFSDYAVNTNVNPPVLYGNVGSAVNTTVVPGIAGSAYQFNGTTSRAFVASPVSSMNGLTALSVGVFYNDTSGQAQGPVTLVAKEATYGATVGWGLYYVSTASALGNMLIFEYEQEYVPLKWSAPITQAQTIGWHQAIVSFDGINVPTIYLDGIPLAIQQISPLPALSSTADPGMSSPLAQPSSPTGILPPRSRRTLVTSGASTGITFSTPTQSNARVFTFTVTGGATQSGSIMVGGISVNTIAAGDIPSQIASKIVAFTNSSWTAASNGSIVTLTFGTTGAGLDTNSTALNIGASVSSGFFKGIIDEVVIYNRALTASEAANSFYSIPLKNTTLLSSIGNIQYTYIDHKNGLVVMKLQYNSNGPLGSLAKSALTYSTVTPAITETYNVSVSDKNVGITEMGLFDINNTLVAYATFPPIIYNAANYHLSFNLLIQQ